MRCLLKVFIRRHTPLTQYCSISSSLDFDRDRLDLDLEVPEHPLRPQGEPDDGPKPFGRRARRLERRHLAVQVWPSWHLAARVLVAIRVACVALAREIAPVRGEGREGQAQGRPGPQAPVTPARGVDALRGRLRLAEVGLVATVAAAAAAVVFRRCSTL